jgi:hypothetical protein
MAPVKLTDKDVDALTRVVATEADHRLIWSHPEEYTAQVHGIVDTVLNRVASGRWGDTIADVANADRQFSAINGPGSTGYGTVDKVPDSVIPAFLPNIVTSWVTARSAGTPSSVGGNLHYANPTFSDASNMGWINALDGPTLGYGNSTHVHGTTTGFSPVEAVVEYGRKTGTAKLEDIQDREAARLGYGEIAPNPLTRPNYFNETGAPPVPLNRPPPPPSLAERTNVQPLNPGMSPALQAARARLETARQARAGVQTPEALAVTPRLTQTNGEVDGIVDTRPGLDWDEFKPGMTAGGAGSLFDERISPSAANPAKPPVLGLRLPVSPTPSQSYAGQERGQPHTASAPAPQRTVNANATAVPANRQPQYATTATGKQVELGKSYILGDKLKIAELGKDGKAVFRDVEEYRDDFLRQNVDQNAPLVFDKGAAGSVARAIAAPMVKQGLANAGEAAKDALSNAATGVVDTVTGAAKQAGNVLSSFLNRSSSNDNAPRPQSYAGQERIAPSIVKPANTLTIKPAIPQTYAGQEATKPKTTTKSIVNPAYTEWEKEYGDGSQVQTAATGAPITKNQLAAIQSMNGVTLPSTPAPAPAAPPPPPPKMITVTIPAPVAPVVVNTLPPAVAATPAPVTKVGNTLRMSPGSAADYNAQRKAGVTDWTTSGAGVTYSPTLRDKQTSYHTGGSASNKANKGGSDKNDRMGTSSSGRSYDTKLKRWVG